MLTVKEIMDELIAAHDRGVKVEVLMEKSVFQFVHANDAAFDRLKKAGVLVYWSSEKDFNFNHSKYFLIDSMAIIGTGNMTKTSLLENRDFFVVTSDVEIVAELDAIFTADSAKFPIKAGSNELIVAPDNSRKGIESLLKNADKSIYLFAESLSDESIVSLLLKKKQE